MVAIATDQRRTGEVSEEERELRIQLAAAYRLADKYGMSEQGHAIIRPWRCACNV